jgi:hypothetical protein
VPASLPVSLWRVSVFDCRQTASLNAGLYSLILCV